jgi:hypothetical protein
MARTIAMCVHELATTAADTPGRRTTRERAMVGHLKGESYFDWRPEGLACEIVPTT